MAFTGPFEDRLAIHELILSYADAINTRDGEAWISCWAEDAEWNLPMIPGMETTKGREAILATWMDAMARYPGQMVAHTALGMLEITGDTAIGRAYPREFIINSDGTTSTDHGRYDDEYVKQDGVWLFKSRTHTLLHSG
jgi:uncharacterized protein (TIGR02246 family)